MEGWVWLAHERGGGRDIAFVTWSSQNPALDLLKLKLMTRNSHRLNTSYQRGNHSGMLRSDILTAYELSFVGP